MWWWWPLPWRCRWASWLCWFRFWGIVTSNWVESCKSSVMWSSSNHYADWMLLNARGPKVLQLEVGTQRAPRILEINNTKCFHGLPTTRRAADRRGMMRYCKVLVVSLTWPGMSLSLVKMHIFPLVEFPFRLWLFFLSILIHLDAHVLLVLWTFTYLNPDSHHIFDRTEQNIFFNLKSKVYIFVLASFCSSHICRSQRG